MTLVEAAEFLFVSRAHVKKLVESGRLIEVMPRNACRTPDIDVASGEMYKAELDTVRGAYLDSQTEDDDPMVH
ncbi:hypothetical protein [Paraburkholderia fynbosensis]|uniref:Helix-turn-helix domain-containing protein n=1 Tax=Paraburkholderia fynbosensis TaxID=1200993 RepID=A0A6J5G9Q7_9BURK|nr:hypothetical protein [Paraburkholderia fynbosensis]CAB3794646.1 hypothetical protein LMG27177_03697 [Paraburkholderia fynbosensis]